MLDRSGLNYAVSKTFHALADADTNSTDFKKTALDAIRRSEVFSDILNDFKNKLPDVGVVAQRLEKQRGFNAERAKVVAGVLQKSLEFAGILDKSNNILPIRDNGEKSVNSVTGDAGNDAVDDEEKRRDNRLGGTKDLRRSEVPLSEGRIAVVLFPQDLTETEATKVGKVLAALVG
jgi:hypothetical protein